jgi:hypothetical protein
MHAPLGIVDTKPVAIVEAVITGIGVVEGAGDLVPKRFIKVA